MRHPLRWFLVALAVVVIAGGALLAWYVFGDDAPAKPTLSQSTVKKGAATGSPDGTWRVAGAGVVTLYEGRTTREFGSGSKVDALA